MHQTNQQAPKARKPSSLRIPPSQPSQSLEINPPSLAPNGQANNLAKFQADPQNRRLQARNWGDTAKISDEIRLFSKSKIIPYISDRFEYDDTLQFLDF